MDRDVLEAVRSELPEMVSLRRAVHREPELGLDNPLTRSKIIAALSGLPLDLKLAQSCSGLVATLRGKKPGRRVLLRADTDALPLSEGGGGHFASIFPGRMHACGHDAHVAMLVGAARILCARADQFDGEIVFMFQPGEEGWHGARHMLDEGMLEPLPDAAFALHILPNAPHGVFSGRAGTIMASNDTFEIAITGRGGHASMPHNACDPIPVACEIVMALQAFITRQISVFEPAVATVAQISAGSADNVIAPTATISGTIRTLAPQTRCAVEAGLNRLADGIAAAHGATASVRIDHGYPVTVCDPRAAKLGEMVIRETFGDECWVEMASPMMGAEDFSYLLEKVPGAFFFLGAAAEGSDWSCCAGLHSNEMTIDEAVMLRGAAYHVALAERFLADGL
jgi:hippurate hydrolase